MHKEFGCLPEREHAKTLTNIQYFNQYSASDGPVAKFALRTFLLTDQRIST